MCGEYGDTNRRPHYHVILFGYDFPDRKLWSKSTNGNLLYRSALLEKVWPFGHTTIGALTPASAGYVARYCLKKITGPMAEEHYKTYHPHTGEIIQLHPEFIRMSTRPGIGASWYEKYSGDAFPSDFVIVDGSKKPVPRYYTKKLAASDPEAEERIKLKRTQNARHHKDNNTPERLETRAEVLHHRVDKLKRDL